MTLLENFDLVANFAGTLALVAGMSILTIGSLTMSNGMTPKLYQLSKDTFDQDIYLYTDDCAEKLRKKIEVYPFKILFLYIFAVIVSCIFLVFYYLFSVGAFTPQGIVHKLISTSCMQIFILGPIFGHLFIVVWKMSRMKILYYRVIKLQEI